MEGAKNKGFLWAREIFLRRFAVKIVKEFGNKIDISPKHEISLYCFACINRFCH